MNSNFKELLINIIAIVVFANMAYMIMPESNLKKFVKLVLGLIVIVSIMTPVVSFILGQDALVIFGTN